MVRTGSMARFKQGLDVDQGLLLPPSIRDWLPEDPLAWFIMDAVDSLDIDMLLDSYRAGGKGEFPYDPGMMLRVLTYAYATGTFSSRRIESQLHDSVAFRVLAREPRPHAFLIAGGGAIRATHSDPGEIGRRLPREEPAP
jgi:hypothetical protein